MVYGVGVTYGHCFAVFELLHNLYNHSMGGILGPDCEFVDLSPSW